MDKDESAPMASRAMAWRARWPTVLLLAFLLAGAVIWGLARRDSPEAQAASAAQADGARP